MARTAVAQKQNLIKSSNDITVASWATDATSTVSQVSIVDPTGATSSCGRLTCTGGSLQYVRGNGYNPAVGVGSFTMSAWVKTVAGGTQTMRLKANTTGSYSGNLTVTGIWTRISYTATDCTGVGTMLIAVDSSNNALDVYLYGIQIVQANWMGPLVLTTGTAVNTGNIRNIQAQSQNLFTYSDDLSNAVYTIAGITVPIDATVADPFGGYGSTALTEDAANAVHRVTSRTPLFTDAEVGKTVSITVWAKKGTETVIVNSVAGLAVGTYDLNAGTATAGTGLTTADIVPVANGFYKCTNTFVVTSAMVGFGFQVAIRQASAYQGTLGNKAIYIMGFQKTYANWSGPRALTTSAAVSNGNIRNIVAQKQNLVTRSRDAANAAWTKLGLHATTPIVSNDAVGPSGTTTADRIVEDASTGLHIVYRNTGANLAPGMYTISASLKQATRRYGGLQIIVGSALQRYFVLVDLQTGTVVSTSTTGSITDTAYTVVSQGNGWYRLSVTARNQDLGAVNICVSPSDSASPSYSASFPSYTGDNTSGIYATDYQVVMTNWLGPVVTTTTTAVDTGNIRRIVAQNQNLFANSQELQTACSAVGGSITTDTTDTLDPWGTNTAEVLVEDGGTSTHRIQNLGGVVSAIGLVQTLSVYVKAGVRTIAYVQNSVTESITVDLTNGNVTSSVGGIARGAESVGNGWYRIWITFASPATSSSLYVYAFFGGFSYTGVNGTKALYIAGGQYVTANWKGPYVRTTSTLVNTGNIRNIA
mgnify:CR=1 FL=1